MLSFNFVVRASVFIVLSLAATANSQVLVECYTLSTTCMISFEVVMKEDCCNNSVEPLGGSFFEDGIEGCQTCDVVFGFVETTLIGPEQPGLYTVGFGFQSGFAMDLIDLNFQLSTGTASGRDVVLLTPSLVFPPEQRLLTNISLQFVTDGVAQELNETFTITFTGVEPMDLEFGATVIPEFTGTIVDVDALQVFFTEDDYAETEGVGTFLPVMIAKDRPIANPLELSVTPLVIGAPELLGLIPEGTIPPDNPLSPNRADEQDFISTVVVVTFFPDELVSKLSGPVPQIPAPVDFIDDEIDEAPEQLFVVTLNVISSVNLALVDNTQRNFSVCRIRDDDPLRIGFEFPSYTFPEPASLTVFQDSVFLVKEDNRISERTFNVTVTVDDPPGLVIPATLESTNLGEDFDYSLGEPGVTTTTILFLPNDSRLAFTFELNDDDLTEGTEAFQAVSSSTPGSPDFLSPLLTFSETEIRILDGDMVVVGFLQQFVNVSEGDGEVTLQVGVISGTLQRSISLEFQLVDGSAMVVTDYLAVANVSVELSTDTTSSDVTFALVDDTDTEDTENLQAVLSFIDEVEANVTLSPSVATITIVDDDNGDMVNDSTIGDPFFTVPVYTPEEQLRMLDSDSLALCYELHGEPEKWFNLVTDKCVTVNAHFVFLTFSLTVIDDIGIKAVDSANQCVDIRITVHQCAAQVNGIGLGLGERFSRNGVSVRRMRNRVRISVPNCNDLTLVMWVFCEINLPGQPGEMIKFVVTRGLNFGVREAHGLFGQFWNAPASISPFDGQFKDGTPVTNRYLVNITRAGHSRGFVGFYYPQNWQGDAQPCMYVGNKQAGPNYNIADYDDGVVEGTFDDYEVPGPLTEGHYKFGLFEEDKC